MDDEERRWSARAHWRVLLFTDVPEPKQVLLSLIKCQQRGASVLIEEQLEEEEVGLSITSLTPAQLQLYHRHLQSLRRATGRLQFRPAYGDAEKRRLVTFKDGGYVTRKLPRFFSWLVPGYLAGLSTPKNRLDVRALETLGVRLLITVMDEAPLPRDWFQDGRVRNVHYPVQNLHAPTVQEVDAFLKEVDDLTSATASQAEEERPAAIAVHCGGGVGRTGCLLACYLLRHGATVAKPLCWACKQVAARTGRALRSSDCQGDDCPNAKPPALSPAEAIELVRLGRPGSLESQWQEHFVKKYSSNLWSRFACQGEDEEEDATAAASAIERIPLSVTGKQVSSPSFVVLIGLPGSGKSWLADMLVKGGGWVRISQDVEGSRERCVTMVSSYCKHLGKGPKSCRVILDRCNPTAAERKEWMELAFKPRDAVAVYFTADIEVCRQRINSRFGHETIRAGGGKQALADMAKRMEPPTLGEGFAAIYGVHSFDNARSLLERWTGNSKSTEVNEVVAEEQQVRQVPQSTVKKVVPEEQQVPQSTVKEVVAEEQHLVMQVIKFPRTPHLFNTGGTGVSDDDEVADFGSVVSSLFSNPALRLHVQEKVDGGNLGFSLSSSYSIVAQNRSHYITSKEQAQYGLLDCWVPEHRERLMFILGNVPSRKILFGEWMVAKHSIHYTQLPDYFLAYDIYDVKRQEFYSVAKFNQVLKEANELEVEEPIIHTIVCMASLDSASCPNTKQKWSDYLMSRRSAYRDGPVEGIYIRVDQGDRLKARLKLVRPDFVAGNQCWSKHRITKNVVLR